MRFDKVHGAAYSARPGTIAFRTTDDDIPGGEKARRLKGLDQLQESIQREINAALVGQEMEILVEGYKKGKWEGRTRSNKLVFFQDEAVRLGQLINVKIEKATPRSLQGTPVEGAPAEGTPAGG